ncbi:AbrB family transcriptional regulator [Geosporobacter ferrireducens]|uniref:Ammonia monooxygenase n=1 Tax=Geosporobacter ferrireducens TaxID=1424294 RepID=A0A1D8GIF0_9FIRM|nr:AbrB family transcriptional regulator [Geosporobacter ferrireducens]AOT70652.1 hypothetical protein Gferi_14365 [Geosporobacter ferrireducens]
MWVMITILVAAVGGLTATKLKVPAGAIIGSLLAVVVFNLLTGKAVFPQEFKMITQIGTGTYIGSRICKKDVVELKKTIIPAIILTVTMCVFNIAVSIFLTNYTNIDLVTALFATAPAGVTDMTLISVDFGADSSKVAALQLIRLISVIAIMPMLIKHLAAKVNIVESFDDSREEISVNTDTNNDFKEVVKRTIYTLSVGIISGCIGYFLGVPAGIISFAMVACAFYNVRTSKAYMSIHLRKSIQFLGGALIGARITMEQVVAMKDLLLIISVVIVGYIALNFLLAFLISKHSTLDIITSLYASAAGGLTDMAIIASEMGADAPKVATLQFARVVSVIAFYPIIIKTLLNFIH